MDQISPGKFVMKLSDKAAGVHKFSPNLEDNAKFYVRQKHDIK